MMSVARLAVELGRRLDGPHADEHTADAGALVYEAVRFLNYATGPHAADGLAYPATVYAVAADLSAAVSVMPQLLGQLARWLAAEAAAGRLGTDDRTPPGDVVAAASARLSAAATLAAALGSELAAVQNSLSGLNGRGPNGGAL